MSRLSVYRYQLRRKADPRASDLAAGYGVVSDDGVAAAIVRQIVDGQAREHFVVVLLDNGHRVTGYELVAIGSDREVHVCPREVFRCALLTGAASIVLGHNHPSGQTQPSAEDDALTRRLVEAGRLIGVSVLDHVVVSDRDHYSYSRHGRMPK